MRDLSIRLTLLENNVAFDVQISVFVVKKATRHFSQFFFRDLRRIDIII